jgi:integrase
VAVYKRADNQKWAYRKRIRLPNGRKQDIAGTPAVNTKAAAEKAERDHIERLLNPPLDPAPRLADFAEVFMDTYVKARGNKPSERASKRRILDHHLLPRFGRLRLDEIGREEIDKIKAELLESGRQKKTVNNIVGVLSTLLAYAVDVGKLASKPKIGMYKVAGQPFRFLDFHELSALLTAAEPEPMWRAAILLGADAGLRMGEIRALEWRHVQHGVARLSIEQALWRDAMGLPKGNRARIVPMTRRLQEALKRSRHLQGPYVVPGEGGTWATIGHLRWNLARLCRKAGIAEIGWHALRHTFCSHLAMKGAPARTIQELAGHASLSTTQRYMHLSPGATDAAIALLDQPLHEHCTAAR